MSRALSLFAALLTLACSAPNPDFDARSATPDASGDLAPGPPDRPAADEGTPIADVPADVPADLASEAAPDGPAGLGQPCSSGASCASGTCVHGVCCNTDCRQRCWSCTLADSLGTCTIVPVEEDPHDDCPAEALPTCGRSGSCDGAGACTLHADGTECRAQTCTAGVETAANLCDGAGQCAPGTTRACPLGTCMAAQCAVECSPAVPCAAGSQCVSGRCTGNGPTLHWRFDEDGASVAIDATGNFPGTYVGEPTAPQPSTNFPTVKFTNQRSRTFPPSGRPGVSLTLVDNRLMPANNLTIALWFRATSAITLRGSVFSISLDVMLRVGPNSIEFAKRKSTTEGAMYALCTLPDLTGHLDGKWHHLAGVLSSKGMDLYLDGSPRHHVADNLPIMYRPGATLWVGREGSSTTHDYRGDIDDVRVYTRALTGAEIFDLAAGNP